MSTRMSVNHMASVAIIYRESDPDQLFLERKDGGLPMVAFRWWLNLVGGNWIGEKATADRGPIDTARREIEEELTLDRKPVTSNELEDLGLTGHPPYVTFRNDRPVDEENRSRLALVREAMTTKLRPFGDYITVAPKSFLDAADPKNTRDGWTAICSYFTVGLDESTWKMLCELQALYGNLSGESLSVVTSVTEIMERKDRIAFGHDRALREFLIEHNVRCARDFPLVSQLDADYIGQPRQTYEDYVGEFDIKKHP